MQLDIVSSFINLPYNSFGILDICELKENEEAWLVIKVQTRFPFSVVLSS